MLEPKQTNRSWRHGSVLPSTRAEPVMWLDWLVRLRWVALVAQALVISVSLSVLDMPGLTVTLMACVMLGMAGSNHTALQRLDRPQTVTQTTLALHLLLDVVALSLMLELSGGASNPFVLLYFLFVAIAGIVLEPTGAAAIAGASLVAWMLLHLGGLPLHLDAHPWLSEAQLQRAGDAVAFLVTGGTLAWFVIALRQSLRRRELQLAEAREALGEPETEEVPRGRPAPAVEA